MVDRVNNYIENDLADDVIDPDGGVNTERKRARLGLPREEDAFKSFPTEGFEVGVARLPAVGYSQIFKFLIEDVEVRQQLSVEKPIVKGYNFFKSGKVKSVYVKVENGAIYIKSQVIPSYAKYGALYTVKIIMDMNSNNIVRAYCPCPAGVDGRCNHLAGTLFAITDIQSRAEKDTETNIPCTSQPCKWSVPPKTRAQPTKIQEVSFEKHVWGKERKYSSSPKPAENDVRAPSDRDQQHDFNILHIRLREIESKKGKKIGLSLIIPHDISTDSEIDENKSTESEEVPQQKGWSFVSPIREQPVSLEEISERAKRARCRLFESSQHREKIAKLTSKQQNCRMWYEVRQPRISASQCKRCVLKPTTSPSKAVAEVLFYGNKIQTKAMKDGIEWEPKIIERFMADTGHHVRESGFVISESHPFLGASPDGITEEEKLVEVKKVTSKEGENLSDALCRLYIYRHSGTELVLNRNHKYFYQIQQQLFCTKLDGCHFVVCNGDEIHYDIVSFDSEFWMDTLHKLEEFYFKHIFPELIYPKLKFGQERWNSKELKFPRFD